MPLIFELLWRLPRMHVLCLTLAALVTAATCSSAGTITTEASAQLKASQQSEAHAFWSSFREAVEEEDWPTLASMSAQPLIVRGMVDSAPVKRITDKKKMAAVLRQQLNQPLFAGKGKPMRSVATWVRETPILSAEHWLSTDQIRVQNLVFRKGRDGWKLTSIYDEEL